MLSLSIIIYDHGLKVSSEVPEGVDGESRMPFAIILAYRIRLLNVKYKLLRVLRTLFPIRKGINESTYTEGL